MSSAQEKDFQNEIIAQLQENGWLVGESSHYDRKRALYPEDLLGFVQTTQPEQWQKYQKLYPNDTETHFLNRVEQQLAKANSNAVNKELRTFGTLGVLHHELKDRNTRFRLCQFRPDHDLNPETLERYHQNRLRVVPELVYSPYATAEHLALTGAQAKAWRIDLVLFVNGLPVATLELKSEFKQAVEKAKKQYRETRLPKDPATNKPEPLLTFKRGALVHFAVSQWEVFMTTRLAGNDTYFLPFNKGTQEGGAGNDVPANPNEYATEYLWRDVLAPDALLAILGRFVHLQIEEEEDWEGKKVKKEKLIFPRFHQWDVVTRLIADAREKGAGHKYLIQHSAGSGKSNSIAWTAHQLASLYDKTGNKRFNSVIVVTDRTVLDDQLQDTIYQFEHAEGVVGRISNKVGEGSKSEKLANALESAQPIIIVTIQTFPYVLQAIENSIRLKERNYAIIADEAHSSQSGSTARQLKEVLMLDANDGEEPSAEDLLDATMEARKGSNNLSFFAFTATPKSKTLELFGTLPEPTLPPSATNKPHPWHVYSMRQAIEEHFILDVLKNYTSYKVAYQLAQKVEAQDDQVDAKKAKVKLTQWVKLHDYNIAQKVKVIVEHFRDNIQGMLGGQAKAMVVTGSRKEAVRYKLAFDQYVAEHKYKEPHALVAFSGEVMFNSNDPHAETLLGEKFTESSMNPGLKKRDMRDAFDTDDYQVMLVANKFQTGFDQPKLCAMYVDKKLAGVDCVQTLSRLNRTYPGKEASGTYVLDFFNDPEDVLDAFRPYYKTAELTDVSDPNAVFDLFDKLKAQGIFNWTEVEQFCIAFFQPNKSSAAISNICKPAVERWQSRYKNAVDSFKTAKEMFERCKASGDAVLIGNAEQSLKQCQQEKETLELFKKDLGSFVRFYEFMSQIVDYNDKNLEKLSLYARHLRPLLREELADDDEIDFSNVTLSHYRLSKLKQQNLKLEEQQGEYTLDPGTGVGGGTAPGKEEAFLSEIIKRLNALFVTEGLTDDDMINYARTVADKIRENQKVMHQVNNNSPEQAMLGDFTEAMEDAVLASSEAHKNQMMQILSNPQVAKGFAKIVFELLIGRTF